MLEQHPPHVRKKIALGITVGVGVLLVIVLIVLYTLRAVPETAENGVSFREFYATILDSAQSFFTGNRAILNKQ